MNNIASNFIKWPSQEEKSAMRRRLLNKEHSLFRDCIGIVDETLFPLFRKPAGEPLDYFCYRKQPYGFQCTIICDDRHLMPHNLWQAIRVVYTTQGHFKQCQFVYLLMTIFMHMSIFWQTVHIHQP